MTEIDPALRSVAFRAAYRMLGSIADAEDVAQTAIERMLRLGADAQPRNAQAWLTTVATRLAVDQLRSARARREQYVGDWLPEPLVGSTLEPPDASEHAELAEELSFAFLVLLETLTPSERAAFLLHDVLDYPYEEVASILDRPTSGAVRQLVSRARTRVAGREPRYTASSSEQQQLVTRFMAAIESGEVEGFVGLLTEDVAMVGDGGGQVPPGFAISRSVRGAEAVAKLLASFGRRAVFPAHMEPCTVNGGPGVVVIADLPVGGGVIAVMSLDVQSGRIAAVHGVVNPDKLRHLVPVFGPIANLEVVRDAERAYAKGPHGTR
ncbi:RNA polymerase sigma factor SigJ [Microbacterium horticulturae]|uniref:RNA polymerase sigma factor SigJ n=1 Tax=Microbacterium horticulturae TaxID=3028316 RepID=A0ABY8BTA8_9MICO|nr:RNA polymerase sigma factor SigJ [Microbacterium sp. KACC 23027]WEG07404.1 RNA polymerase sigma factor SigJ [Microbacterium sp. KACC 23027]